MGKRILILSAAVGAGHLRAAEAVAAAVGRVDPTATVQNTDVLTLATPAFRKLYGKAYLDLVNRAPHVLGYLYDRMDRPVGPRRRGDRLRLLVERMNMTGFGDLVADGQWDVVVNTHFLPAEMIAGLRKRGKTDVRQITVSTDFETHRLWVNEPTDLYTTATEEGAAYLTHFGVAAEKIRVTGIPIHPIFTEPMDRQPVLAAQGLAADRPVVVQLAGGFGVGPIAALYRGLLSLPMPLQIVVVAGRNASAKQELEAVVPPPWHRVKILGFTDRMHELMTAADLVVSKPGGLTTSEVLASGAAMAIVNPIPGQESRNSDYLLEEGAAVKINNLSTLPMKLEKLLGDPARLRRLRDNARRIARPNAATDVAKLATEIAIG